jgi:hypothetical protein
MTTAVALIGLSYRATDLQQWPPGIFMELDVAALYGSVETTGTDQNRLSGGVYPRNRVRRRRAMRLFGECSSDPTDTLLADQRDSFLANLATLEALFDETEHGDLVATLPDATTRTIDARPAGSLIVTLQTDVLATVSITLHSYESPDWIIGP